MTQAFLVPRVETKRLILRGWEPDDYEPHAAMSSDPEVMRHIGGAMGRAESWRKMALHIGHWALRGYGNWVIERKTDARVLGRAGLWNPEGWPGLEVGWKLARHAWGHGYATEAGQAALEWAWTELRASKLISVIQPDNAPSIGVAKRLGLRPVRSTTMNGQSVTIFEIELTDASFASGVPL